MKRRILIKPKPHNSNGSSFYEAFGMPVVGVVVVLAIIACVIFFIPKAFSTIASSSDEPKSSGATPLPDDYSKALVTIKNGLNKKYDLMLTEAQVRELDCRGYLGYRGTSHYTCLTNNSDAHDDTYGSTLYTDEKGKTVALTLSLKDQRPTLKTQFDSQTYSEKINTLRKTLEDKYKASLSDEQMSELNCQTVDESFGSHHSSCFTFETTERNQKFGTATVSYNNQEQKATLITDGSGNPMLIEPGTEGQYIRN